MGHEGGDDGKPGLVLAGGRKYLHDAFASAFHQAFLECLESRMVGSDRNIIRAVRDLRSSEWHNRVLRRALGILADSPPYIGDGRVVAIIYPPVDNRTSTG